MTNRPKDISASVRARLGSHAQANGRPFQEVMQYYAIERFLHRLAVSKHRDRFVLKGGAAPIVGSLHEAGRHD